ncbi:MAG: 5-formyltetrahydrofolate cyclo-ligase [Campylobacterales bacterium]|nr:5-formyltetrahydrofolate cyclo-ligase [Campylobacterales bacterium]
MTKSDFRCECLQKLRSLPPSGKRVRDARVNEHLLSVIRHTHAKRILFYWPFGFEADIRKTIFKLRSEKLLYLPFMEGVSFKMVPLRLPLERKAFGIYEPRVSTINIRLIDIAIVPVIGVDGVGGRIGFGKGMYDRFFPTLKSKPLTLFVQSSRCVSPLFLCDEYDIRGDLLITPDGVHRLKDFYDKQPSRKRWSSHPRRGSRIFNF